MGVDGDDTAAAGRRDRADLLCERLGRGDATAAELDEAARLLRPLREAREFGRLCYLAEQVCRWRGDDMLARVLYAQGLIESRQLVAAVHFLEGAKCRVPADHPQWDELQGLLGRAWKQIFVDGAQADTAHRRRFLMSAMEAYAAPFERDPAKQFWQGVNLAALAMAARHHGIALEAQSPETYAAQTLVALDTVLEGDRDHWWHATRAEALLGIGEWKAAESSLRAYLDHGDTTAFSVAATLRQFRELWQFQKEDRGARLLQMLEATLVRWPKPGAALQFSAEHVQAMRELKPAKDDETLQRVVGPGGFETVEWYQTGLQCAASVAAVKERLGLRVGTGFAVRAGDFGIKPSADTLLLTNHHVLNSAGLGGRTDFGNVEIVFSAAKDSPKFGVVEVVAESPHDTGLDFALLRLSSNDLLPAPLSLCRAVDMPAERRRVYVIGYPLGDVLQFSLHNNELLDHECDPCGRPPMPARRRLQYSASTEQGNSGSPVFNDQWECIALHHAGARRDARADAFGLPALNGGNRRVEANQGIWIGSIVDHVARLALRLS